MSEIDVSGCNYNTSWNNYGYCEIYKCRCYQRSCYYKQLQQLKAENEDLKKQILKQANAKIQLDNLNEKIGKDYCNIKQCLDEIEKICQNETINLTDSCVNGGRYFEILELIKQAKEGDNG